LRDSREKQSPKENWPRRKGGGKKEDNIRGGENIMKKGPCQIT